MTATFVVVVVVVAVGVVIAGAVVSLVVRDEMVVGASTFGRKKAGGKVRFAYILHHEHEMERMEGMYEKAFACEFDCLLLVVAMMGVDAPMGSKGLRRLFVGWEEGVTLK